MALFVNVLGDALGKLFRPKEPRRAHVDLELASGDTLSLSFSDLADLRDLLGKGATTPIVLSDGRVLDIDEIVHLAAAARNAAEAVAASEPPSADNTLTLYAPQVSAELVEAYRDVLADEYSWVPSSDLSLTAEYFAMRDSGSSDDARIEWTELSEDSTLLTTLGIPPALNHNLIAT
jgi:hypothetical protein